MGKLETVIQGLSLLASFPAGPKSLIKGMGQPLPQ